MKEKLIQTYDILGAEYFGKASDGQLKLWGHTQEQIDKIKIESVERHLEFSKRAIKTYKIINELCGGKNEY